MRRISNEQLAAAVKVHRIRGGRYLIDHLGRTAKHGISPLRTYMGAEYYSFADGRDEYLVVSRDSEWLFAPLLRLEFGAAELGFQVLSLPLLLGAPDAAPAGAVLTYGDTGESITALRLDSTRIDFDLGAAEGTINLGSVPRVEVTFSRFDQTFNASYRLPYVDANEALAQAGLGVRATTTGNAYFFRSDASSERLEELSELIEEGEVHQRFVDVIARIEGEPRAEPHLLSVDGAEFLAVDTMGHRHIIHDTPARLEKLDAAHATAIAETLRVRTKAPAAPQRRNLRTALRPTRRRVMKRAAETAVRSIGFERYERTRLAFQQATTRRTPYESYAEQVDASTVVPGTVLIDGYHGRSFSGSMLALAMVWPQVDPGIRLHVAMQDVAAWQPKLRRYGIPAELVRTSSQEYYDLLRTAQYVLTDSTLPRSYLKTEGQRLINTWHGTPLKRMGRDISSAPLTVANVQRNFLLSDLVTLNSRYGIDRMTSAFMVDSANFALLPSARNSMLLADEGSQARLRAELDIGTDEVVVLWMPTWRGAAGGTADIQTNLDLFHRVAAIRARLQRPVRFFAKTHQFLTGQVELSEHGFEVVPNEVDVYEFMSVVDALVTDYSSVFFDFAVRNKPIVLDMADLDAYVGDRGLYLDPNELPFTVTHTDATLLEALEDLPASADHSAFNAEFNPMDHPAGAAECVLAFTGLRPPEPDESKRERVLLFPGSLKTNGITTSFLNLMSKLDAQRQYEVWAPLASLAGDLGPNLATVLDSGHRVIISPRGMVTAPSEKLAWSKMLHKLALDERDWNALNRIFDRESRRVFGGQRFDHLIHFSGYDALPAGVLCAVPAALHIYIHNNMKEELELRNNFNSQVISRAYAHARTIPVVSEAVLDVLLDEGYLDPEPAANARVVHNTLNRASIVDRSLRDEEYLTSELHEVLTDPSITRFVNVARFSPEKGQDRLIRAFESICRGNPDRRFELFLIGGPGNSRTALHDMRRVSPFGGHIHFFENINPMPILARSDLFVLSSYYEGLPMTILEAIALGVPVMSTRIPGPDAFLGSGYGHLVPDSTEGITEGMQRFVDGQLAASARSLDDYDDQAVREFMALFT